jgi:hypothetical protein
MTKIAESGSRIRIQDPDPDPHQNVIDPEHWRSKVFEIDNGYSELKKKT